MWDRFLRSRGPRGMEQEIQACRTTHQLLGIFQEQAAAERDVEPRRVPFTEVLPVVAHSVIECTRADADCAAGEAARMARPPRPPSPGRKDPPAQLPPRPETPRRPLPVPPCRLPATLTQDPLQDHVDSAGLILDFPALVYNVTVASGPGHFTQAA